MKNQKASKTVLVLAANSNTYEHFLSVNKLDPEKHKRITNANDIKGRGMVVLMVYDWTENKNSLNLLHKLSAKDATLLEATEQGYK